MDVLNVETTWLKLMERQSVIIVNTQRVWRTGTRETNMTNKQARVRKVKAWIWTYGVKATPTVSFRKPLKREVENGKLYDTLVFPCTITYSLPQKKHVNSSLRKRG